MTRSDAPRPPAPHPAERARTIAALGGRATLVPATDPSGSDRISPLLHHVHDDGTVSVLLPDDHELVAAAWQAPRGELATMVELADAAPVPLREPIRGLLWITGWLRALSEEESRAQALVVAERRPDPRLLDLGHGAALLRLIPASLVLADAEGSHSVALAAFTAAEPDPFAAFEAGWLRHLEVTHTDVVGALVRHLPEDLRGGHVRPLGLDRFGLRLRVEAADADHDVRLAFSHPVSTPTELSAELRRLVGCPFLAARSAG
ncbi:DUF2470 domain-containing protein [Actinokineospora sp. NBRC 105648]|uniref:DUF2470 domain-containing protein n=1 Tax=Actinokineospora sp. NBRC 105648 TaxID=3032206 RepID=UPI0024A56E24|nr:DUF2470 domain-containing protein [Actinokineospora sp. NBRC 105648]GLZ41235.1 hypothetical protein Acsp05_48590 [Actinokineospora sp. NBRC 105648]